MSVWEMAAWAIVARTMVSWAGDYMKGVQLSPPYLNDVAELVPRSFFSKAPFALNLRVPPKDVCRCDGTVE